MQENHEFDVCIIGAGSGGLSFAAGAVQMGTTVALVDLEKEGIDCISYGSIPSKSILASSRLARRVRKAGEFGVDVTLQPIDFSKVYQRIHNVITAIEPRSFAERFAELGATVFSGKAKFTDAHTVVVNDQTIKAKYFILATGSHPKIPNIPGIDTINYLTSDTIFNLSELPQHLLIIGGGPIGIEMAQAFSGLGAKVTVLQRDRILPHSDLELAQELKQSLQADGVNVLEHVTIQQISSAGGDVAIQYQQNNQQHSVSGSHVFVAAGQVPNVMDLNLEAAGVKYYENGITLDKRLRTTNKHIFAIGDCHGGKQFLHLANYEATVVLKNIVFKTPEKVDYLALPTVVYTTPELAQVGMAEPMAMHLHPQFKTLRCLFKDIERAQTDGKTQGEIKVLVNYNGDILGVTILGSAAAELIVPWVLAIQNKLKIRQMAEVIAPYPSLSEISKLVANSFYGDPLYSSKTRRFLRWLSKKLF